MKGDPILRPEFDLYVKMTAEAMKSIAESNKESLTESRETNQILREYIIHNNHKHDDTNKRITSLAKEQNKLKIAVEANSKVTSFAITIKKGALIIAGGGLTAIGAIIATSYMVD